MDERDIIRLVKEPLLLSAETLPLLRQWVEQYPCVSTYRLLYLKNLAMLHSPDWEKELKRLAISVPDRRRLFFLIEGERYGMQPSPRPEQEEAAADPFLLIDNFLASCQDEQQKADESPLLFQPSASADYLSWTRHDSHAGDETTSPSDPDKGAEPQMQHQELIDSFLQQEEVRDSLPHPLPQEVAEEAPTPPAVRELEEPQQKAALDDSYFTETLARIYVKQKRYDKALQIIKKLSLKYPEKNIYFADQIRFLEKLIINTKK